MVSVEVQEAQGWYGPFTLSERVLQKIWLKQEFSREELRTLSGKSLEVLSPGRWNLLGGPDFKDARLRIDGRIIRGDVEVHFYAGDWFAHQHQSNPAFNEVRLHVLLYPDLSDEVRTLRGNCPEALVLMPLLNRDLEDIATDEALLKMERVNELEWVAEFLECPVADRAQRLHEQAELRWSQKCRFAEQRLKAHGWSEACHQFCLEVLGYRRNRGPMAKLALNYPLMDMCALAADQLYEERAGEWTLSGLRPANHPRLRLQQYLAILEAVPDWPLHLGAALEVLPSVASGTKTTPWRREADLRQWCAQVRKQVFQNQFGETRFHTMMVDSSLPLAAAAGFCEAKGYWMHWYVGDVPPALRRFLKEAELINAKQPMTNGLIQGALGLFCRGDA